MSNWIRTPNGAKDIPVGEWCVIMEGGDLGYCHAWSWRCGSVHHMINGAFYYDNEKVLAYTDFPSRSEEEQDGEI